MNVILKTKSWTYVWLTILLARPAKTEALVFCCSLVVFFCLLLRAWCVKVRQSAVAGRSQTLEDFDRLSALAWGALAIWSVGSRGPWGHIQVKFVCEGRHNFLHIVFVTHKDVYGGEESAAGMRSSSSNHPWPWKGGHPLHLHSTVLQKQEAHISRAHALVDAKDYLWVFFLPRTRQHSNILSLTDRKSVV